MKAHDSLISSTNLRTAEATQRLTVIVLSGSTGRTADQVLKSALAQFEQPDLDILRALQIRSVRKAKEVVKKAAKDGSVILHTLVAPKIRDAVVRECERRMVPTVDVLGPTINALADHLGAAPRNEAGLSYEFQKEQFDRLDAVDFALAHDDGARARELSLAEVVLVGPSRVSKSVTCVYLACRGIRVANVPLIPQCTPPPELLKLNPHKVIGLTMNAHRLKSVRTARSRTVGRNPKYADLEAIASELRFAHDLMLKHRWRCIDVSYKAVEEVAKEVIEFACV